MKIVGIKAYAILVGTTHCGFILKDAEGYYIIYKPRGVLEYHLWDRKPVKSFKGALATAKKVVEFLNDTC